MVTTGEQVSSRLPLERTMLQSFLGAFAKLRRATISFVMSFRPSHGTTGLPLDGFS